MKQIISLVAISLFLFSCGMISNKEASELTLSGLNPQNFNVVLDQDTTRLFVLKNSNNMEVCIINFGGRIVSLMVPDKNGMMRDVVLGFDSIQDYIKYPSDFGATIGRYANRINQGRFTLDGKEYQLPQNNYGHCLHGGPRGFQYVVFDGVQLNDQELKLTYVSKDMEEGFPGNLTCCVIMKLTDENALEITYEAQTDQPTIINMTNHSYFNLDGTPQNGNSKHLLMINGDYYTPVDSTFMTNGEIVSVEGTPMDFRKPVAIESRIDMNFNQLKNGHGIDHNWVLNTKGDITKVCASLESLESGIKLEVYTDEPGIQIYSGNFLDSSLVGKKGIHYPKRASVCMETQKYPDSPNKPQWPSCIIRPGEKYSSHTTFKFSALN